MTSEKILEVIMDYRRTLYALEVQPAHYPHNLPANNTYTSLAHCCAMLDELERFVKEGQTDKAFRWLGFVQGVMWTCKVFTITDLKDHNKPDTKGSTHTVS